MSARRLALAAASIGLLALAGCASSAPAAAPLPTVAPSPIAVAADAAPKPALVHVQVLAFNDFHGHLEPPAGTPVGGVATLAAHIARLRAGNPNTVVVSAGDLTGASPLISSLFRDEPTVLAMNRLGLDFEAVGNHDFDRGMDDLRRLQKGDCAEGNCGTGVFPGASYRYLAANVRDTATGATVFPPYAIRAFGDVKVAFIGETLMGTPGVTTARAVKGLSFADEADTANALVPELQRRGVAAIVLVVHQGGMQHGGTYDSCNELSGDLLSILPRLDPAIHVVVSGHTHQAYDCTIDGRVVTSAGEYGKLVTAIDLAIDPATRTLASVHARNLPVTRDIPPDADLEALVAAYAARAHEIEARVVGFVQRDLVGSAARAHTASCETPLGDVIADAMRESSGADVAFMNPGGIRGDITASRPGRAPHVVTYADAFEVEPFQNRLVTMTLTGAQLQTLLERQFGTRDEPRILQVSRGFTYRYRYDRAAKRGTVSDLRLGGKPVKPAGEYHVTVPSFLAGGGDAFHVLTEGRDPREGVVDVDALTAYLGKHGKESGALEPPATNRIDGDACR
ncbi:MAG TPA: bifunctional metallophosphatase/5'-nucleotidase [Polyangiaceae bacterium]|jgi:5'-nucleotidase